MSVLTEAERLAFMEAECATSDIARMARTAPLAAGQRRADLDVNVAASLSNPIAVATLTRTVRGPVGQNLWLRIHAGSGKPEGAGNPA